MSWQGACVYLSRGVAAFTKAWLKAALLEVVAEQLGILINFGSPISYLGSPKYTYAGFGWSIFVQTYAGINSSRLSLFKSEKKSKEMSNAVHRPKPWHHSNQPGPTSGQPWH